jgi:hypothetical protein
MPTLLWEVGVGLLLGFTAYYISPHFGYLTVVPVFILAMTFHLIMGVDSKWGKGNKKDRL